MEQIVRKFIAHTLSGEDILNICDGEANILATSTLNKYNNIDDVLGRYDACILLYDLPTGEPGHWSCIMKISDRLLEFFCPYGLKPDEANEVTRGGDHILRLIANSDYKVLYSDKQLQRYADNVNVCGRYVGLRIALRELSLKGYIDLLTKNKHYTPDFWVTVLTLFCEN